MKTYQQLKEETVELNEIFGLGNLFGGQRRRDLELRLDNARKVGPEAEAKEKLNIYRELLKGMVNVVKAHPTKVAVGLGVLLADLTIASKRRDMYAAGVERRGETYNKDDLPKSVTGIVAGAIIDALGQSSINLLKQLSIYALLLMAVGFSLVGVYKLLRMLVVRGPQWLDSLISTRDEKALAYTLKREFDTDVFTSGIRTGSPGQGKITATGARRGRPPKNMSDEEIKDASTFPAV